MVTPEDLEKARLKRRRAVFRNIYRNYKAWGALIESEGIERAVVQVEGEEVHYYDLMAGYDDLPPRQKEAFDLHLILGYSEQQAADIMLPGSKWSTSVQQYSATALERMMEAHDRIQTKKGRDKQFKVEESRLRWFQEKEKAAKELQEKALAKERELRPLEDTEEYIKKVQKSLFED